MSGTNQIDIADVPGPNAGFQLFISARRPDRYTLVYGDASHAQQVVIDNLSWPQLCRLRDVLLYYLPYEGDDIPQPKLYQPT